MNAKRIWLILPGAVLPYIFLGALAVLFFSPQVIETAFGSNIFLYAAAVFAYAAAAVTATVVAFVLAVVRQWDALSLAKTVMLVKLLQIPGYIAVFVLGFCLMLSIFTYAFIILLVLFDVITLLMSGLLCTAAVIGAAREGHIPFLRSLWVVLLQFVFCADVAAAVIFYIQLKRASVQ